MLIVDHDSVTGNVFGVPLAFQPANILPDQIIILERRLFQPRISIIKPEQKASLVHPRIVVGENYRPDRTQVQDKVRVRREPSYYRRVLVRVRQRRQSLGAGLASRRYCLNGHDLNYAQLDSISYSQKERTITLLALKTWFGILSKAFVVLTLISRAIWLCFEFEPSVCEAYLIAIASVTMAVASVPIQSKTTDVCGTDVIA